MNLKPLVKKEGTKLKVGILMSGSGTNAEKIIEYQKNNKDCDYKVTLIFSDNPESNAKKIGSRFNIPVEIFDIEKFYQKKKDLKRFDLKDRQIYDKQVTKILSNYEVEVLAYAGYMNITTKPIISKFLGVNVHPADLSIKKRNGKRKYTGAHGVRDAIKAGEKTISSTTHIISEGVDEGPLLMISSPLKIKTPKNINLANKEDLGKIVEKNQDELKRKGDWLIFPKTLDLIAKEKILIDKQGNLYFNNQPIPEGIKK
jgi:folate-dependent phosphoribosylglycinamide formyltransferase PurN